MDCDGDVTVGNSSITTDYSLYVYGIGYATHSSSATSYSGWGGIGTSNGSGSYYRLKVASGTEYSIYTLGGISVNGSLVQTSDKRLKKNINKIDGSSALDKLSRINGSTYEFKDCKSIKEMQKNKVFNFSVDTIKCHEQNGKEKDSVIINVPTFSEGIHYGLIAQDIQKEFPEMVNYDSTTNVYQVDYISFIPVLIEATKEQESEISSLKSNVDSLTDVINTLYNELKTIKEYLGLNSSNNNTHKSATVTNDVNEESSSSECILEQNSPNPFNKTTLIEAYIATHIQSATLYIYNLQGKQKQALKISDRGNIQIKLNGNTLNPGVFLYSLIADGNVVDTKRMVLTE